MPSRIEASTKSHIDSAPAHSMETAVRCPGGHVPEPDVQWLPCKVDSEGPSRAGDYMRAYAVPSDGTCGGGRWRRLCGPTQLIARGRWDAEDHVPRPPARGEAVRPPRAWRLRPRCQGGAAGGDGRRGDPARFPRGGGDGIDHVLEPRRPALGVRPRPGRAGGDGGCAGGARFRRRPLCGFRGTDAAHHAPLPRSTRPLCRTSERGMGQRTPTEARPASATCPPPPPARMRTRCTAATSEALHHLRAPWRRPPAALRPPPRPGRP